MTEQEAYDRAALGLKSQDFRYSMSGSGCVYTSGEDHCAIGWLIAGVELPATIPEPSCNSDSTRSIYAKIRVLMAHVPEVKARLDGLSPGFVRGLQSVHDEAAHMGRTKHEFRDALLQFGRLRRLSTAMLDEVAP